MKEFNPIATIKKYKLLIICLSLLAGLACYFLLSRQQSYTATAILEYTNEEADQGKAPDGTTIDPSEIYSTEVMKQVFARMDMDYEDYNLDKFRSKVVVKEVLSDEESAIQTALNEKGETMTTVATKYAVSITLDESDAANPEIFVRQLMENMLDVYLSVYGEKHVSGSIIVNDIVKLQESGFDYIEAVEAIDDDVIATLNYLGKIIGQEDPFRSSVNGYSFADLYREFQLIAEDDVPNLYAYVLNNRLTKNADILVAKYQQRIEDYKIENEASLRQIEDIKAIIAAYVEMMRSSGNTDITYEYILDEVYDAYFQDKIKEEEGTASWINPDETVEYEVLLESYIEDRTNYEYALIETAYCEYIIDIYTGKNTSAGGSAQAGEPLNPYVGATGDAQGAETRINDLMTRLDALYQNLTVLKTEYNAYSGAANVGLITNIVVNADVQVMLYTLLLVIVCMLGISAAVIFLDRFSDIMHYYIYMDRKFLVANRAACDRYLNRHERQVLKSDTVCISINISNLRDKNKEFGRETCDNMIRSLADLMKRVFPDEPDCFMAMNGQGQFVVFVKGVREAQAVAYMKYLELEKDIYNSKANCPIVYNYGIAEAGQENVYNLRGLLVNAVNKANASTASH